MFPVRCNQSAVFSIIHPGHRISLGSGIIVEMKSERHLAAIFVPIESFGNLNEWKCCREEKKIVCRRLKINRNFPYPSKLANFMLARIARKLIKICQIFLANLLHDYFKINELIYRQVMQYCDSVEKLFVEFLDPSLSRKHDKLVSKGC